MANETTSICMICGKAGRMGTCMLCGSLVCNLHFNPVSEVCTDCEKGRKTCKL